MLTSELFGCLEVSVASRYPLGSMGNGSGEGGWIRNNGRSGLVGGSKLPTFRESQEGDGDWKEAPERE